MQSHGCAGKTRSRRAFPWICSIQASQSFRGAVQRSGAASPETIPPAGLMDSGLSAFAALRPRPGMTPDNFCLRQPALAPAIVLALAERFALAFGDAEIEFLHVLVLSQGFGVAVEHNA